MGVRSGSLYAADTNGEQRHNTMVNNPPVKTFNQNKELYCWGVVSCLCIIPAEIPKSRNIWVNPRYRVAIATIPKSLLARKRVKIATWSKETTLRTTVDAVVQTIPFAVVRNKLLISF